MERQLFLIKKTGVFRYPAIKKTIPHPFVCTGMETIRGIPDKYLFAACMALSFLLFGAGGTAFGQSPFYGGLFMVAAMVLFFIGVHFGRKEPGPDE